MKPYLAQVRSNKLFIRAYFNFMAKERTIKSRAVMQTQRMIKSHHNASLKKIAYNGTNNDLRKMKYNYAY